MKSNAMLSYLVKGLLRDRSRTLFPLLVISAGVLIIVFSLAFMQGYRDSIIRQNARFQTGHLKIVSKAYAELIDQKPTDLGFIDIEDDLSEWRKVYPQMSFLPRMSFGALMDVPDRDGFTRAQGDVIGMGISFAPSRDKDAMSGDVENLRLKDILRKGSLPYGDGQILVSDKVFNRLGLALGDTITLIGASVYGAMSMRNFSVCGTIEFGMEALDRGGVIADIRDIRSFLDMPDGATEILVFANDGKYRQDALDRFKADFNKRFSVSDEEFSPLALTLRDQNQMGAILSMFDYSINLITTVFIFVMGIVLWNSGLMSCIRRYQEIGVRLAMGEHKMHLYLSLIVEALCIGLIGSLIGTLIGLGISAYFNKYGLDVSAYNRSSNILSENLVFTSIDLKTSLWGFIPGVLSTVLGSALAGSVIFKRKTSQLFKELEV